ncbi:MAG: DUF5615 family PIN-like protein [Terriglobia bacterium]
MKIRFQADENLDQTIVDGVLRRESSVSFQTCREARLVAADDLTVLQKCAAEGRVLVSHDVGTMPAHFAMFIMQQRSPGVLPVRQKLRAGNVIESLLMIWNSCEASDWENRICYLPL